MIKAVESGEDKATITEFAIKILVKQTEDALQGNIRKNGGGATYADRYKRRGSQIVFVDLLLSSCWEGVIQGDPA